MASEHSRLLSDRPTVSERVQLVLGRLLLRLPDRALARLAGSAPPVVDGQRLDAGVHFILATRRRQVRHGLTEPSVAAGRARYRRETAGRRTRVGSVRDLTVAGADGPLGARLYRPPGGKGDGSMLVYLHGGGFVIGDLDTHDEPCRLLCRHARTSVLSVGYRLAPEHPFPAAVDDALAAWRWIRREARALGADPAKISIGGDSAGGNLAAVVSQVTARESDAPAAQLLIYPAVDATTPRASHELFATGLILTMRDVQAFARAYRGAQGGGDDPRISPLAATDLHGLPPALVTTAGFDVLRDEGEAYAAALAKAGNAVRLRRFPSLMHGFIHITDTSPAARAAMLDTARDWRALLDGARPSNEVAELARR